tara:strand:+ start:1036 stop:1644 length:609 start_codon:yes stop_codon:yes gene_type:complete
MSIEVKISKKKIPYKKAIFTLEKRVEDVKKGKKKEFIWILEHPTTYTGGIRSKENEILDKKINLIKTNRGGKITLHNPGQKIVYFVLDLNKRKKDIRRLVKILEDSVVEFLNNYKIIARPDKKNIGIWVKNKKISAIGIRVSKWVAYHGCSINITNDLSQYKKIVPCGLNNKMVTSIKSLGIKPSYINKNLKRIFYKNLSKV